MFYVDDSGRVSRVSFKPNSTIGKLWTGNRYRSLLENTSRTLSKRYFHMRRKATFFETVKHYCKTVTSNIKSLFRSNHHVYALSFDKKRNLLFSLI